MSMNSAALKAYTKALDNHSEMEKKISSNLNKLESGDAKGPGFSETLKNSLSSVNDLQKDKNAMIEAFSTGKNTNVHELMISMQKASLAMNLTSAVRNKVMSAYKEIMRMSF
jgi:flagellar hook-basal body complex protein FliE